MSKVVEFRRRPTTVEKVIDTVAETLGELEGRQVKGVVMAVVLEDSSDPQAVFFRSVEDGYHLYVAGAAAQLAQLVLQPED